MGGRQGVLGEERVVLMKPLFREYILRVPLEIEQDRFVYINERATSFLGYPILEEIVRCRDCKHYRFVDRSDVFNDERHNDSFCLRFVGCKLMEVEPDGFCAWGERKVVE